MTDQPQSKIIKDNPIGNGLDGFRALFNSTCEGAHLSHTPDALQQLDQEDIQNLTLDLLSALRNTPAIRLLPSKTGRGTLRQDLLNLNSAVSSADFDFNRTKLLLNTALADRLDDALIWTRVYDAVTESTPPPRPIASSLQQTPWLRNTSSFANSSEHREYVDNVLREELGPMYVGLRGFYKTYFGDVPGLAAASEAFFEDCLGGSNPFFRNGWMGWPEEAKQDDVLSWFAGFTEKLAVFAQKIKWYMLMKSLRWFSPFNRQRVKLKRPSTWTVPPRYFVYCNSRNTIARPFFSYTYTTERPESNESWVVGAENFFPANFGVDTF